MTTLTPILFLSFFITIGHHLSLICAQDHPQRLTSTLELQALYTLRASLGIRPKNWPIKTDPCTSWAGLACRAGRVVSLNLTGLHRTKFARRNPSFAVDGLRNLTHLSNFVAAGFPLPGPIPAAVSGAPSLSVLDLTGCSVVGALPDLSPASRLRVIKLGSNGLSGAIPDSIWRLQNLSFLDLSNNALNGTFGDPTISSNVSVARDLFNLSGNSYSGTISSSFQRILSRFRLVDLSGNYFTGDNEMARALCSMNCFSDDLDQRPSAVCEEFYGEERGSKRRRWGSVLGVILGCGGALVLVVIMALTMCLLKCRGNSRGKEDNSFKENNGDAVLDVVESEARRDIAAPQSPSRVVLPSPPRTASINSAAVGDSFAYEELVKATSGFCIGNLIRQGHSGDLYLGVLEDDTKVVVKRINLQVLRRDTFVSELDVFAKCSDCSANRLVPFVGHCLEDDNEKFLVYKYMPHGDLSTALHKKSMQENEGLQSLDWITRLKIAIGIAEALSFLHHECTPPLVHRDLEASSIFLNEKYEVYLGSLSEICTQQSSHQTGISRILRPAQIVRQGFSGCSTATCAYDVYCMGKVLLELVTGKLGISGSNNAATNAWLEQTLTSINIHDKESIIKILDPSLKVDDDHLEEVLAVAIITKSCLDPKPAKRPPARYVLKALENPLKVVRIQNSTNSAILRTSSSRRSWHGAFLGSLQRNSSQIASFKQVQECQTSKLSGTDTSQTSSGDHSLSHSRAPREIFPEP